MPETILISESKQILTANLKLHVAPNGSDETGQGTETNPFATIDYAVVWANRNYDFSQNFNLIVSVESGTYDAVQIYGHDARQVEIIGSPDNPSTVKIMPIREDADFGLAVSYFSSVIVKGLDLASVNVTGFSDLEIENCHLSPSKAALSLVFCSNHSSIIIESALVKAGRIGNEQQSSCYECELHSHIEVAEVDYEANVECGVFCDARFFASISLEADMDTKNNVKATRFARAVAQSVVCDSDFFPEKATQQNLVELGGQVGKFQNSQV
ncbi:MAG: acetylornithine aminotransferase [Leptolyngbya sp. SIO1E4]|nr:acetylornithine aminotransferase [Leptolyngbya sp. SIO1E4]